MAKFKGSNSSDTSEALAPTLVDGVTAENYGSLGRAFMGANGGSGFLIATANGKWQGVDYSQTLKQWGAWVAFFKRKKIAHTFMRTREFYTVPAEWPHLFTADATELEDSYAGAEFERRWLRDRGKEREYGSAIDRQATIAAYRSRPPFDAKRQRTPDDHLVAPEIDREALFRSHDEAMAK